MMQKQTDREAVTPGGYRIASQGGNCRVLDVRNDGLGDYRKQKK